MTGDRMLEASDFLSQFVVFDEEEPPKKRRIKVADRYASDRLEKRKVLQNVPVPHETLEQYPLLSESNSYKAHADVLRWLVDVRKISLAAIRDFQLRLYIEPVLEEAGVIFPIISRLGPDVLDLWVRMIPQKRFFRLTRDFTGSRVDYRAPNLWFGNHLYTEGAPILLVEGALDALRLYSLGVKNVLASFGEPSTEQIASVYAPVVHLGYDSDESGRRFTKNLKKKLDAPSIHILDWSVVGLKDAGELEDVSQLRVVFDSRVKTNETRDGKSKEVPTSTKSKSKILRFHKKDDLIL
jgi:5S rRNA maturation endonuclease (ribonuclease M5)